MSDQPPTTGRSGSTGRSRTHRRRRRAAWVNPVRALCGVLSVVLLTGTAYGTALLNRVQSQAGTLEVTEDVEHNVDRVGNFDDENILVVGNDARFDYTDEQLAKIGASPEESMATDTIMLIHVPADGSGASVVSFPRDSYVEIPGYWTDKINAAYSAGYWGLPDGSSDEARRAEGQKALIATVSQVSGMKIDHYVEVSLIGFYDLTEALGGIEVNLCAPAYDPTHNSGADFPAGEQTLNGSQALSFVRQRHGLPNEDLDRIKRQQYFVGAVIRKVLNQDLLDLANLGKLTGIIDALAGTISYDKGLDPIDLAEQMSALAAGNVTFQTIPLADGDYNQYIDERWVVLLADQPKLDEFFASLGTPPAPPSKPSSPASSAPSSSSPKPPASDSKPPSDSTPATSSPADKPADDVMTAEEGTCVY